MSDIHSLPGVTEAKAKSVIRQHRKASFYVKKYLMIFVGALIAAIGLELFLIPNNVIDGGAGDRAHETGGGHGCGPRRGPAWWRR